MKHFLSNCHGNTTEVTTAEIGGVLSKDGMHNGLLPHPNSNRHGTVFIVD